MRIAHLAALAMVALLAGCAAPPPIALPPAPTATPMFASDDEALAAAVEVYEAYGRAADEVAQGGWTDLTPLEGKVTPDFLDEIAGWAQQLSDAGYHREGEIAYDSPRLQEYDVAAQTVSFYVCNDLAGGQTIDSLGAVVRGSGPDRSPEVVTVVFSDDAGLVSDEESWDGPDFC